MPVILLSGGRKALVVGGGRVAFRKISNLLNSGMKVVVVSDDISDDISNISNKQLSLVRKKFQPQDITRDFMLVVAATNDKTVNKDVIETAAELNILSASVDGNWTKGDFIFPAVYRDSEVTLSVSTHGKVCRKSRLIKNLISKHISEIDSSDLYCIGTDYRYLNPNIKNSFFEKINVEELGNFIKEIFGIHEFFILLTCNRFEVWALASQKRRFEPLLKSLMGLGAFKSSEYYVHTGFDAFVHSVMLLAGEKSELKGEHYIVSQVKKSKRYALSKEWANGAMSEWVYADLNISKLIRNSKISPGNEIENLVFKFIDEIDALKNKDKILILGTGMLGQRLYKTVIKKYPSNELTVGWNRNRPKILKEKVHVVNISELLKKKLNYDVVIIALSDAKDIIKVENINNDKKLLIIDLSVPSSVSVEVKKHSNINFKDMSEIIIKYSYLENENSDSLKIIEMNRDQYDKIVNNFKERQPLQ